MLLFIMHIPGNTTKQELVDFVASARHRLLRWLPFFAIPTLAKCEIVQIVDSMQNTVEYHSLVSVKAGHIAMERLNGAKFFGKPVQVKPYCRRSPYKDRRRQHADLDALVQERRRRDRRRPSLIIRSRHCRGVRYA
jgi:hypothetical protein